MYKKKRFLISIALNCFELFWTSQCPHNLNLGQLAGWCIEHSECTDETEPDKPFVVDYNVFFDDDIATSENHRGDYEIKNGKLMDDVRFVNGWVSFSKIRKRLRSIFPISWMEFARDSK